VIRWTSPINARRFWPACSRSLSFSWRCSRMRSMRSLRFSVAVSPLGLAIGEAEGLGFGELVGFGEAAAIVLAPAVAVAAKISKSFGRVAAKRATKLTIKARLNKTFFGKLLEYCWRFKN